MKLEYSIVRIAFRNAATSNLQAYPSPKNTQCMLCNVSRLLRMYSKKYFYLLRQPKWTHTHTHTLCGWKEESLDATR